MEIGLHAGNVVVDVRCGARSSSRIAAPVDGAVQVDLHAPSSIALDLRADDENTESADTTAPAMLVAPSLIGGVGSIIATGGVADEPCINQLKATKSRSPDQFSAWSLTYSTDISNTMAGLESGTWTVSVRLQDALGNTSNWMTVGSVYVSPDIGG